MNIAERIQTLINKKDKTFDNYVKAVEREANSLCKRMGIEPTEFRFLISANSHEITALEKKFETVHTWNVSPLFAIMSVISRYPYIVKLHDKFCKACDELEKVRDLLK